MTLPARPTRPRIDYLSRDYASLRQLLLDQFSLELPEWTERHAADLGVVLVELLAYAGDYLSYYQDAAAAEAYLATARQRISLRRHARLLDYPINEGLNARVFVHMQTAEDHVRVPAGTALLTKTSSSATVIPPHLARAYDGIVFETMHDIELFRGSNGMQLEAEGIGEFSLPVGATSANLRGDLRQLRRGDLLLFELSSGSLPGTKAGGASGVSGTGLSSVQSRGSALLPGAGHVVRLSTDPILGSPVQGRTVTHIEWCDEDALPFAIPITVRGSDGRMAAYPCVVRGNMVMADEGRTISRERLEPVPASGAYRPRLLVAGVTHAAPYVHNEAVLASAAAALVQDPRLARAAISLTETLEVHGAEGADPFFDVATGRRWTARRDLLSGGRLARDFVAEIDNAGIACLRFGDGEHGCLPQPGISFQACYRVGHGAAGNVGAQVIRHVVSDDKRIVAVSNPFPASGGADPEAAAQIRTNAPQAFRAQRLQRRCITEDDYVERACRFPGVESAVAKRIWPAEPVAATASEEPECSAAGTVTVRVARTDRIPPSDCFLSQVQTYLADFALIGDRVLVEAPPVMQASLSVRIAVRPGFAVNRVLSEVQAAVEENLAGKRFSFGQPVHASEWTAIAARVPGVATVWTALKPSVETESHAMDFHETDLQQEPMTTFNVPPDAIASVNVNPVAMLAEGS